MRANSYTSASIALPVKILQDGVLMEQIVNEKIVPLRHLQLCITNKCNLSCQYCSCGSRDKNIEMPFVDAIRLLDEAKMYGCKAVTVTGGGEPLMHPDASDILNACLGRQMKVGLVTNGLLLERLDAQVDWCRISFDSHRTFRPLALILNRVMKKQMKIDWAFSYVAYKDDNYNELKKLVNYANHHDFTHVRVVGDILHPSDEIINACKRALKGIDKRVIYQPRTNPTAGRLNCRISLLKPTVAADGTIYPCCGAQYAIKDKGDFPKSMSMGKNLGEIIDKQQFFDGSMCEVCYYDSYNSLLDLLMSEVKHGEFV